MKELKDRLNFLLTHYGWDQKELANKIPISESAVSRWCSGEGYPRKSKYERLSHVFKCNQVWLETGYGSAFDSFATEIQEPVNAYQSSLPQHATKAQRIEKALKSTGKSYRAIAKDLNVSVTTICDFAKGEISDERIIQLAEYTGFSENWLKSGLENKEQNETYTQLMGILNEMNDDERQAAIGLFKALMGKNKKK